MAFAPRTPLAHPPAPPRLPRLSRAQGGSSLVQSVASVFLVALFAFVAVRLLGEDIRCRFLEAQRRIVGLGATIVGQPPPGSEPIEGCAPPEPPADTGIEVPNQALVMEVQRHQDVCPSYTPAGSNDLPDFEGPIFLASGKSDKDIAVTDEGPHGVTEKSHNSTDDQKWWPLESPDGSYRFEAYLDRNNCLGRSDDGPGAYLVQLPCTDPKTAWTVESLGNGKYRYKVPGTEIYVNITDGPLVGDDRKPIDNRPLRTGPGNGEGAEFIAVPWNLRACGPSSNDPTIDELTLLGSHNSYSNYPDTNQGVAAPNQGYDGVTDQLGRGVRALNFDIYPDPKADFLAPENIINCHKSCDTTATRGERIIESLTKVVNFLNEHPDEFVTIHLEDFVKDAQLLEQVIDAVPGLRELLFNPVEFEVLARGWPKKSDLIKANKRILLFTNNDYPAAYPHLMHDRKFTVENYWSMATDVFFAGNETCTSRFSDRPLNWCDGQTGFKPLFVMNNFRDWPSVEHCLNDNGSTLSHRASWICPQAAGRKPNVVLVDCASPPNLAGQPNPMDVINKLNQPDPDCCRPAWCQRAPQPRSIFNPANDPLKPKIPPGPKYKCADYDSFAQYQGSDVFQNDDQFVVQVTYQNRIWHCLQRGCSNQPPGAESGAFWRDLGPCIPTAPG